MRARRAPECHTRLPANRRLSALAAGAARPSVGQSLVRRRAHSTSLICRTYGDSGGGGGRRGRRCGEMTSGRGTRLTRSTTQSGHRSSVAACPAGRYVRRRRRWKLRWRAAGRRAFAGPFPGNVGLAQSSRSPETNDEDVGTTRRTHGLRRRDSLRHRRAASSNITFVMTAAGADYRLVLDATKIRMIHIVHAANELSSARL